MSHFAVLVIGEDIDAQLSPFQENNMGNCPTEFMTFNDMETESKKEFSTGNIEMIKLKGKTKLFYTHDEQFKVGKIFEQKLVYPEGSKKVTVTYKKLYKTFKNFMKEYHGHEEKDEKTGKYGYWENPNRKWDWYEIGGRWTGYFRVKNGASATKVGTPGLRTKPAGIGTADSLKLRDIDWEGMMEEAGEKAAIRYTLLAELMGGSIQKPKLMWKDVVDGKEFEKLTIEQKRDMYWNQEPLKLLTEIRKRDNLSKEAKDLVIWLEYEDYCVERNEYIKKAELNQITPHAIVKDGKWCEAGEMGFWGVVHNEKDSMEWHREFQKLIKELPGDTLFTIVDCHI